MRRDFRKLIHVNRVECCIFVLQSQSLKARKNERKYVEVREKTRFCMELYTCLVSVIVFDDWFWFCYCSQVIPWTIRTLHSYRKSVIWEVHMWIDCLMMFYSTLTYCIRWVQPCSKGQSTGIQETQKAATSQETKAEVPRIGQGKASWYICGSPVYCVRLVY